MFLTGDSLSADYVSEAFSAAEVSFLGEGTFGETWKVCGITADDITGDFAVKILRPRTFDARLLEREVQGLARITSSGIVRLHEVREVKFTGGMRICLVCELVPGGDVAINSRHALPQPSQVAEFGFRLLSSVAKLHAVEVIHRDIKAENIILRHANWADPVLIDFGLSKGLGDQTHTVYPARVGTYTYMSPEQLRGERARKASDLWACGIVLYQLLANRHPYFESFQGLHVEDLADLVDGPPPALPEPTLPDLEEMVVRLLSQDAYKRGSAYRAASDLREMMQ
jgi:serine/threonine protein kinase